MNLIEFKDNIFSNAGRIIRKFMYSFFFKVFITAFVVFGAATFAVYNFEKDNVVYKIENGQKVEDSGNSSNLRSVQDVIWWIFVTTSTTGYGDFFPKTSPARMIAVFVMFFGIVLAGVSTGNIASYLIEKQLKEGRGLNELKLKDHFIICGWKRGMSEVLENVLQKNKTYRASDIVLINTAPPEQIENLKADSRFAGINFVSGDYIDERILHRANLKGAKKVLMLADRMVEGSVQEVDSRTVMAVLAIKAISKTVYIAAELLDSKFESYLVSNCDEIILSSEYNRTLIANASAGGGISHVVAELLNVKSETAINTVELPKEFIGKLYSELSEYFLKKDRSLLIGILENTGNFFTRKKEAIKAAQKTPDISKLVDNLKVVKSLAANLPVLNPESDYVLKSYSRAIIIEGRKNKMQKTDAV
jgi:voltage-gated potassium channel